MKYLPGKIFISMHYYSL